MGGIDMIGMYIAFIILFAAFLIQNYRDSAQIKYLLDTNRQLSLMVKAKDAIEAQTVIERDKNQEQKKSNTIQEVEEELEKIDRTIQVGGRKFSIFGLDPDQEDEFIRNVSSEVTNAVPVSNVKS